MKGRNFTEVWETTLLSLDGCKFLKLYQTKLFPNEIILNKLLIGILVS